MLRRFSHYFVFFTVFGATILPKCGVDILAAVPKIRSGGGVGVAPLNGPNLLVNGSFEVNAPPFPTTSPFPVYTWINSFPNRPPLSNAVWPISGWQATGGVESYAYWAEPGSPTQPAFVTPQDGAHSIYFGNGFTNSNSGIPPILPNGVWQFAASPTFSPVAAGYDPVTLSQTMTGLTVGATYQMSFWTAGEATHTRWFDDGMFAVSITGYDPLYLTAPGRPDRSLFGADNHTYLLEFRATNPNVTVEFTNYGHILRTGEDSELVLDNVIVNRKTLIRPTLDLRTTVSSDPLAEECCYVPTKAGLGPHGVIRDEIKLKPVLSNEPVKVVGVIYGEAPDLAGNVQLTTVYGTDLDPNLSDDNVNISGFKAAPNEREIVASDETFFGISQEYKGASLGTFRIADLASNELFSDFDVSQFTGDPDSIVYAFRATVPLADMPVLADLSIDGSVDAEDAGIMFENWGAGGVADLNDDDTTDAADAGILFELWTGDVQQSVPESCPAGIAVGVISAMFASFWRGRRTAIGA